MRDSTETGSIDTLMDAIGKRARAAARRLALAPAETKNTALQAMADALVASTDTILAENAADLDRAAEAGMAVSFVDRLTLTPDRITAMADGLR
ncbi:MAG: gamma-glutamyl-phosphate reductase, partial [Aurantimonas coralicida]